MSDAERWDRSYREGEHERQWDTPWASPELAGALAAIRPRTGSDALDSGCGTGADAVFMASIGLTVPGVDLSATALELAVQRAHTAGVGVRWLIGDALDLPVDAESMDLATDCGCLHHIPASDRRAYASEIVRVLRLRGLLLIRGMSQSGRHKHAVTPMTIRTQFPEPRFGIHHVGPFEMVGPHGVTPATIAIVERR